MQALVFLRTALTVLILGLMLLGALAMCALWHLGDTYFAHAKEGIVALATVAVIHSGVQHLGNGTGLGGMLKTLVTNAKPETAEEPK